MNIAKKPQTDEDILHYINQTKDFWKVKNFQKEILDFEGFPPHVPQGTPAFLKITFQLHRNPTVLCMYVPVCTAKVCMMYVVCMM